MATLSPINRTYIQYVQILHQFNIFPMATVNHKCFPNLFSMKRSGTRLRLKQSCACLAKQALHVARRDVHAGARPHGHTSRTQPSKQRTPFHALDPNALATQQHSVWAEPKPNFQDERRSCR